MKRYNVFEDTNLVKTVTARSAQNAISKVEDMRGGYLFNPQAVNVDDPQDAYPLPEDWKPNTDESNYP